MTYVVTLPANKFVNNKKKCEKESKKQNEKRKVVKKVLEQAKNVLRTAIFVL